MEFEKIKAWLDEIVDITRKSKDVERYNDQISICNSYEYSHLYEGIDIVADVMGFELVESKRDDEKYKYEYSFLYKGIKFLQIEEKRLESYAGR